MKRAAATTGKRQGGELIREVQGRVLVGGEVRDLFEGISGKPYFGGRVRCTCCHRPANVTASGPGRVIQKKSRKLSNGQRGLPRRPGSSPAVEDGASQGARSDERSSLALDWRWPLPQRTERIVSMNSVSGSVPPVPTRSVGPVHDNCSGALSIDG